MWSEKIRLRHLDGDRSGEVQAPEDQSSRDEPSPREGEVQHLQETPLGHADTGIFEQAERQGEGVRTVSGVPQVEGGTSGKELKSLPPKTGRKIRAALKRAVAFWRQIQLLLADDGNQGSATVDLMRRMNQEICNELQLSPKVKKIA